MAQEDLDAMVVGGRGTAKTAEDNLAGLGPEVNDVENAAAAEAAGVLRASFINYDVALEAYEARSDVEELANKNARDMPADFAEAGFMRQVGADDIDHGSSAP